MEQGGIPRSIRPGPCFLPARMRVGGLSTMDMKFGSSPGCGCCARRVVRERFLHAGQLGNVRRWNFFVNARVVLELQACRNKDLEEFMTGGVGERGAQAQAQVDRIEVVNHFKVGPIRPLIACQSSPLNSFAPSSKHRILRVPYKNNQQDVLRWRSPERYRQSCARIEAAVLLRDG
jgi:hypothetical protein